MDCLLESRLYPHIYFSGNPFKIVEYDSMMRSARPSEDDVILDLGCGAGLQTALLGRKARRVIGVDVSEGAIGRARTDPYLVKGAVHIEFICSSLMEARFENEMFDKIYSFCVLEHIPDYRQVLQECFRILKPAGWMVFSVDGLATIDNPELKRKHALDQKVLRYFTPQSLTEDLLAAGFRDVGVQPMFRGRLARRLFEKGILNGFKCRYSHAVVLSWLLRCSEIVRRGPDGIFLLVTCRK